MLSENNKGVVACGRGKWRNKLLEPRFDGVKYMRSEGVKGVGMRFD